MSDPAVSLDPHSEEREAALDRLRHRRCTLEEAERLLARLREITPWLDSSDRFHYGAELNVASWRIEQRIEAERGNAPVTRETLVGWVRRGMDPEHTTEAESSAYLNLVQRHVPHPTVTDLIFYPDHGGEVTAEWVVDEALRSGGGADAARKKEEAQA